MLTILSPSTQSPAPAATPAATPSDTSVQTQNAEAAPWTRMATVSPVSPWALEDVLVGSALPDSSFSTVKDAVKAADRIMDKRKKDATSFHFPFSRKIERVDPIAVVADGSIFNLHETNFSTVDPFDFKHGYIFKSWYHVDGRTEATRLDPRLQAIVGWSRAARFDRHGDNAPIR